MVMTFLLDSFLLVLIPAPSVSACVLMEMPVCVHTADDKFVLIMLPSHPAIRRHELTKRKPRQIALADVASHLASVVENDFLC